MVIAAVAAVLLVLTLVAVIQTAPTTGDRSDANPAMSAEGKGGSISTQDQTLSATLKWSNAWAMAVFGKACGEGEREPSATWS